MPFSKTKKFLEKSIYSSPDDIEKTHHKIANFILKIISIFFVTLGLWLNLVATNLYYYTEKTEELFNRIITLNLFGIGFDLIGIFIALILLVRYIAFTLPDRIYERNKKRTLKHDR